MILTSLMNMKHSNPISHNRLIFNLLVKLFALLERQTYLDCINVIFLILSFVGLTVVIFSQSQTRQKGKISFVPCFLLFQKLVHEVPGVARGIKQI